MKVFISHSFADEELASILKSVLAAKGISGYMAQRVKEYELLIREKIKKEITESDYVVAIITKDALASASVNEEIGYALGQDVPVVIMIEKDAKIGVLIHGQEPEEFIKSNFESHCSNITNYLAERGNRKKVSSKLPSEEFLKKRNLHIPDREEYAVHLETTDLLFDRTAKENIPNTAKRFVFFSACPKFLSEDIDVTSKQFDEWLTENNTVNMGKRARNFLPASARKKIKIDSIIFQSLWNNDKLQNYVEFNSNGFLGQGITNPLIRNLDDEGSQIIPSLHLCWTTGAFWSFVIFSKKYYYNFLGLPYDIDVCLSIHNAKGLMLYGFGGRTGNGVWAEPLSNRMWSSTPHYIEQPNISLKATLRPGSSDEEIAGIIHKFSDKTCNSAGLASSLCYNDDGTFNHELFSWYDP